MTRKASTLQPADIIPLIIAEAKRLLDPSDFSDFEDLVKEKRSFAFGNLLMMLAYQSKHLQKDLKIQFDWENYNDGSSWELSPNGFWYLKMWAGGDWESPVYFVIYWDGSNTRAYVPTSGNVYNRATKTAYGNDDAGDAVDIIKQYGAGSKEAVGEHYNIQEDWALMELDINKRITV